MKQTRRTRHLDVLQRLSVWWWEGGWL